MNKLPGPFLALSRRGAAGAFVCVALAGPAAAHERWVEHALLRDFDRTLFREPGLLHAALALALAGLLVALGCLGRSGRLPCFRGFPRLAKTGPLLARVGLGLSLVLLTLGGTFVAPDLVLLDSLGARLLGGTTLLAGVLLVVGWHTRAAALAFLAAFAWAVVVRPFADFDGAPIQPTHVLIYFELVAIAAYLRVRGSGRLALDRGGVADPSPGAARLLQRLLGLNILAHGLMKLASPELPMGVLQNYTEQIYDPVRALVPISEEGFVLAASSVEIFLGSAILLGVLPLLSMLAVLLTFLMTTWVFRGDLVGHLPRIGAMLALILAEARHLDHRAEGIVSLWRSGRRRLREGLGATAPGPARLVEGLLVLGLAGAVLTLPLESSTTPQADGAREPGLFGLELGRSARGVGAAGRLAFEVAPLPRSLRVGEVFTLRLRVQDAASGRPWVGNGLPRVAVTMPRHGHGMSTLPLLSDRGQGWFELEGCQFNMHGLWQIEIEAGEADQARFELRYRAVLGGP